MLYVPCRIPGIKAVMDELAPNSSMKLLKNIPKHFIVDPNTQNNEVAAVKH